MNKLVMLFLFCSFCFISTNFLACESKGNGLYVSLSGSDDNPGTEKKPFATLEKARDTIREVQKAGSLPQGGITVYLRGGMFTITDTFKLTSEDSGTEDAPIIYRSYPGESVHFSGGKVVTGFEPVKDPAVLKRINKAYHEKILQTDLKVQGITNFGEMKSTEWGKPAEKTTLELFLNGKSMTIARYPNEGWLRIADVPQTGEKVIHKGWYRDSVDGILLGRHFGRFAYHGDRPKRWAEADDMWVHGFMTWDWWDPYLKIESIDKNRREIYIGEPHDIAGYTKYRRYYILNILEELDAPGEWYLDRKSGILYFWPPSPIKQGDALVSILEETMMFLEETSYITIQGIIFEVSRTNVIKIKGGSYNKIAGCTIRNTGLGGIIVDGGIYNGVISCDIYGIGNGGIELSGGDKKTLTSANNYATNNHIHHYNRVIKVGPAITLSGVGNRISHNNIHDAPHSAIHISGNEHIIEYNKIHDVAKETGDVGAIYAGLGWTGRGNIIKHNYFHNIYGSGMFGAQSIYIDGFGNDVTIYGNVFYKVSRAIFIGGGRDNIVENNIFVECEPSVFVDARGLNWSKGSLDGLPSGLEEINYKEPPYSEKYPELLTVLNDEPEIPKYNKIICNISYGGRWMDLFWLPDISILTMKDNIIADPELYKTGESPVEDPHYADNVKEAEENVIYKFGDKEIMEKLNGNILIETDPGFVDIENENFQLKEDSPAWKLGFKPIPFDKIGLYVDEYRTTLP